MSETNRESTPQSGKPTEEMLHNSQTQEAIDVEAHVDPNQADQYFEAWLNQHFYSGEITLKSSPTANGSLMRSRYFAASISYVNNARRALWDSTEPLFPTKVGDESLAKALDQVWLWIQDSPKIERYEESVVTEIKANGSESTIKRSSKLLSPMAFPIPNGNWFIKTSLPFTYRAYLLSEVVDRFINETAGEQKTSWWRPEWTAVYLTTGHFERAALPRWEVTANKQAVVSKSRGCTHIRVYDAASVSPSEVADAYTHARLKLTEQPSIPKFEITSGRPEEYSTEVLTQLELELILKKAKERRARGESVRPEVWNERPGHKELETAWREKAAALGVNPEKRLTPQSLSNFRSRVRRDLYEPALSWMWSEEGYQRAIEEVDHNRPPIIDASDPGLKE